MDTLRPLLSKSNEDVVSAYGDQEVWPQFASLNDQNNRMSFKPLAIGLFFLLYLTLTLPSFALEPEPRKWGHLPLGTNFLGVGYAHTEADIFVDPTLRLEDVEMELDTWAGKYIRSFEWFGKSARIDLGQSYTKGKWSGLINGVPASVSRSGLSDSVARVAINLYGAPPLSGKDYATYRSKVDNETIVGVALAVRLPTGEYKGSQLVNLGDNRFTFRPQLGIAHTRGKWTSEVTGEVALYTKNDDYFIGKTLEQDPLYVIHGHLSYLFRPGFWAGGGLSYDYGGEKTVNGIDKDDTKENVAWALNLAYPISRSSGVTLKYINTQTQKNIGLDSETLAVGLSLRW